MFNELLADSVAKAIFWLLIIGAVTISLRFLIKDIIDYLLVEEKGKEESTDE